MRPIRILHVVGKMDIGGTESWLMHVLRHIDRSRFKMDFLVHSTEQGAFDLEIAALGSRTIPCMGIARPWQYASNFRRVLRTYGPYDVVHTHVNYFSGLPLWVAKTQRVPSRIAHSHTFTLAQQASRRLTRRMYVRGMERAIGRYSTARLAVSRRAARSLFGPAWREDPCTRIVYCGVDLEQFREEADRGAIRTELGIPEDSFVIGHVGRLKEPKNHRFLVEVAARVAEREPNTRLLLIGEGPLRPEIERRAAELGLGDRLIFTGARHDIGRLMKGAMDVFVFPSLYEGLPLALVEAQASGLPCLYSDAVTREVEVVKPLMCRLSLDESATRWAELALRRGRQPNPNANARAYTQVEQSPFNIEHNVRELTAIYEAQVRGAHTGSRAPLAPARTNS